MGAALVVGGTGMLRGVVLELARAGPVAVVARGCRRLEALAREAPAVIPVPADYRDREALEAGLRGVKKRAGPFVLAACWIHSDAPEAPLAVARFVRGRYFHVLGSGAGDPGRPDPGRRAEFEALPGLAYHEVILGFVREGARSRWLTSDEIGRGVLDAIRLAAPRHVVGVVEPWEARP